MEGIQFLLLAKTLGTQSATIAIKEIEKEMTHLHKNLRIAIMGCPVNGPGEAKEADLGIACNKGSGVIFKKGKVLRQVPEEQLLDALLQEIEKTEN